MDTLSPKLLRRLHVDMAFLSCRGFSPEHGMMESDLREAQMKRTMAETAAHKVAMVDHSKFSHVYVATSLLPDEITLLVADDAFAEDQRRAVRAADIKLELV